MFSRGRRTVGVVTDVGAPGLMLYGLHRDLDSDTDDTDYEPGKKSNCTFYGSKKRKKGPKFLATSSDGSSEDSESSRNRTKATENRNRSNRVSESTDESTAISSADEKEEGEDMWKRGLSTKRKICRGRKKRRRFGGELFGDSDDSDYIPDKVKKESGEAEIKTKNDKDSELPSKRRKTAKKSTKKNGKVTKRWNKNIEEQSSRAKRVSAKLAEEKMKQDLDITKDTEDRRTENMVNITENKANLTEGFSATQADWKTLPIEILSYIFHLVASTDCKGIRYVCHCTQVCKHWYHTASKPMCWKFVDLAFIAENMKAKKADRVLKHVARRLLGETKELVLSGWTGLTDVGLSVVAEKCARLESLNISNCQKGSISKLTGTSLFALAENCSLKKINFSYVRISINYVKTMIHLFEICGTKLTHINFAGNIPFNSTVFNTVCQCCPNLEFIDISNTSVRAISFKNFQEKCPLLQELYFTNLALEPKDKGDTTALCPGFKNLRICSLATFSTGSWLCGNLLYSVLKSAVNLSVLDVRGWSNVSIDNRIPATGLERLFLSQCGLNYETISTICCKWSETLWEIDLSRTRFHGAHFSDITKLLFQGPHSCGNLLHLNISGTPVTVDEVKDILKCCTKLESIDLTSCRGIQRGSKREHRGSEILEKFRTALFE